MGWQWVIGPASGGHTMAIAQNTERTATFQLTNPSTSAFKVLGSSPAAMAITELASDLHLIRDRVYLDRMRIGPSTDTLDASRDDAEFHALNYRDLLARRRLYDDSTLTYTGVDRAQLVWQLIQQTQGRSGGQLGITQGNTPTLGVTTQTFSAGDAIGEQIQNLSAVQAPAGFDWDITPVSPSALNLDVWAQRGYDRNVLLLWGGKLIKTISREADPSTYANGIRQTGADGLTAEIREASDLATRPEGRWDATFGDTTLATQPAVADRATWQLAQSEVIQPTYTLTLTTGAWQGPGHIWLGDTVRLVIPSGRLRVDTPIRVYAIQVDLDAAGNETVQLTLGGPPPDYRYKPPQVLRRLATLERR